MGLDLSFSILQLACLLAIPSSNNACLDSVIGRICGVTRGHRSLIESPNGGTAVVTCTAFQLVADGSVAKKDDCWRI